MHESRGVSDLLWPPVYNMIGQRRTPVRTFSITKKSTPQLPVSFINIPNAYSGKQKSFVCNNKKRHVEKRK